MNEDLLRNHSSIFSNLQETEKEDEIVFKFENPISIVNQSLGDPQTGITQITHNCENETNKGENLETDISKAQSYAQNEIKEASKLQQESSLEKLLSPFRNSYVKFEEPRLRRDVVNKTIFRIIRRYFHSLLGTLIHDYKKQKKSNLMSMLISFSDYLFPQMKNNQDLAQVLSALMFRREILMSKGSKDARKNIQAFLDIQSKYTHKLIDEALSNRCFRIIFKHFIEKGMEFFKEDENVQKHSEQYHEELQKIIDLYVTTD